MPSVSFAMAARNAERFLPEALASIEAALDGAADCEVLLADGASTDGTLDLARADGRVRVVSLGDEGIYDAMNKAVAEATGEFVMILNSDDLLPAGGVGEALRLLADRPETGWASGPALFGRSEAETIRRGHRGPLSVEGAVFGVPAINARVFRRDVLARVGLLRTDIGLAADREFLLRLARSGRSGVAIERPLYLYRVSEGSQTISGDAAGHGRVQRAEQLFAATLIDEHPDDPALQRLGRASLFASGLKQRLRTGRGPDQPWPSGSRLAAFADAAALSYRWRGILSGY